MNPSCPDWQAYERLVARLMADQLPTEYCVTPNARVVGRITGRKRQLDVLIDLRHESDNSRRLVVDAKRRNRKVDVTDVEAFRGLMEDVGATHGYLVCPRGHTKAAERRAHRRLYRSAFCLWIASIISTRLLGHSAGIHDARVDACSGMAIRRFGWRCQSGCRWRVGS